MLVCHGVVTATTLHTAYHLSVEASTSTFRGTVGPQSYDPTLHTRVDRYSDLRLLSDDSCRWTWNCYLLCAVTSQCFLCRHFRSVVTMIESDLWSNISLLFSAGYVVDHGEDGYPMYPTPLPTSIATVCHTSLAWVPAPADILCTRKCSGLLLEDRNNHPWPRDLYPRRLRSCGAMCRNVRVSHRRINSDPGVILWIVALLVGIEFVWMQCRVKFYKLCCSECFKYYAAWTVTCYALCTLLSSWRPTCVWRRFGGEPSTRLEIGAGAGQ